MTLWSLPLRGLPLKPVGLGLAVSRTQAIQDILPTQYAPPRADAGPDWPSQWGTIIGLYTCCNRGSLSDAEVRACVLGRHMQHQQQAQQQG